MDVEDIVSGHHSKFSSAAEFSSLDVVDSAFGLLVEDLAPLELAAVELGPGLPGVGVRLDELRTWLLREAVPCGVRDLVWRALARRARLGEPSWVVGAAGVASPRLRRIADRLVNASEGDRADVEAAVLSGFVEALRGLSLEHPHVEQRLLWAAHRAGSWRGCARAGGSWAGCERTGMRFRAVVPEPASLLRLLGL